MHQFRALSVKNVIKVHMIVEKVDNYLVCIFIFKTNFKSALFYMLLWK